MLLLAPKYCVLVDIFPKKFRPERRFPHGAREPAFPTTQNPPLLRLFQYSLTPPGHYILSPFPARGRFVSARVVPRRTSHELTVGGKYMFKGSRLLIGVSIVLRVLFSSGVLKSSARPEAEPGIISRGPSRAAILRETGHDADTPAHQNLAGTGGFLESAPILVRARALGLENYESLFCRSRAVTILS